MSHVPYSSVVANFMHEIIRIRSYIAHENGSVRQIFFKTRGRALSSSKKGFYVFMWFLLVIDCDIKEFYD